MDIHSCLEYIHSRLLFGKKAGFTGISRLLDRLGNPQERLDFIHVAGTNGKGSVTSMLASVWQAYGKKVGWFTSPYLERFHERIRIGNDEIDDASLIRLTERIKTEVEALEKEECYVTEFEVVTAIGLMYFAEQDCDMVVLETGLGGRLDATNVIRHPRLCVITSIGLDHTQYLGDTLAQIAFEKAGILKKGAPVVIYPHMDARAEQVIRTRAEELECSLIVPDKDAVNVLGATLSGTKFCYDGMEISLPLVGGFQVDNAIMTIEAARALGVPDEVIAVGIARATWPCRFEVMQGRKTVILDGAHNHAGICAFADAVKNHLAGRELVLVFGMLPEKDYQKSLAVLSELNARMIVTRPPGPRGEGADRVYEYAKSMGFSAEFICDNISAIKRADDISSHDAAICVFGSLYLTGGVRSFVENFFGV
ncbi:MAG: bifunctional folylpolyglutamate synthase/dihydrofolate synthase [Ruminococcaceae bacterium]|nr:bifunctional folylpolyglutamate synthase/dihydrofolate synthase [Oscillospiraceae bacterium]